MKKNKMMRAASALLVAVLLTTCAVSGTFAKYVTSGSADDTARVAKWGVEVVTSTVDTAFATTYKDSDTNTNVVVKSIDYVVAPGTSSDEVEGNLVFGVTGTPEVAANINVEFTGTDIYYGTYHPIKFTLHVLDNNATITDVTTADWTSAIKYENLTLEALTTEINNSFGNFNTVPGETLDALYKITWEWDYDTDPAGTNDVLDTKLGDLIAACDGSPYSGVDDGKYYNLKLDYDVEITVTQID